MTRAAGAPPVLVAGLALACAAACGGRAERPGGLADSTYVQVMARLALVDTALAPSDFDLPDSLPRDSARQLVLRRWGVSDTALLAHAEALGGRPDRMQEIWTSIRELADSLAKDGWRPDRSGGS
ncbi:MAG TPA: hypothetical protein VKA44_04670 [Gemmatimonadota bacterium]|nr:hypothetical protein [Gemmatimonadota bacterium]